jgi:hypothetical protein
LEAVAEEDEADEVLRLTVSPRYQSREVGRSLRASIDAAMFMKSNQDSHGNLMITPLFDMNHEVAKRVAEQTDQLHQTVDALIKDLKQQSQEQMVRVLEIVYGFVSYSLIPIIRLHCRKRADGQWRKVYGSENTSSKSWN